MNRPIVSEWLRAATDHIDLVLPYPVSTNDLWKAGRNRTTQRSRIVSTDRYATWIQAAGNELQTQRPGRIIGKYTLDMMLERKSGRRDLSNTVKAVEDLLVRHKVIEDDSLCEEVRLRWSDTIKGAWVTLQRLTNTA